MNSLFEFFGEGQQSESELIQVPSIMPSSQCSTKDATFEWDETCWDDWRNRGRCFSRMLRPPNILLKGEVAARGAERHMEMKEPREGRRLAKVPEMPGGWFGNIYLWEWHCIRDWSGQV